MKHVVFRYRDGREVYDNNFPYDRQIGDRVSYPLRVRNNSIFTDLSDEVSMEVRTFEVEKIERVYVLKEMP